jgi:hypothetical protein
MSAERNPEQMTPEQYGAPEWRLLRAGEAQQSGDEWYCYQVGEVEWTPVRWHMFGHPQLDGITYRRRATEPQPHE